MIVYPDRTLKSLKNSKCVYSVKFLEDTFFGKTKCKIPEQGFKELQKILKKLEKFYKDMQDVEFTVENNKLWMLQIGIMTKIKLLKQNILPQLHLTQYYFF